jgi:ABC-type polar amino acid transport system ATPase subunit
MIEVDSLTKRRAGRPVLDAVSLRGAEAGVTVLVGASGSGKSTLLRCLNGLELFEGGTITIAGHRLAAGGQSTAVLDDLRRDVGMVFQQFNLFPHLSVLDNVMLAPRVVSRVPVAEARSRAVELLDRVGLSAFAAARPATLSGGQQQRVAIARALAMRPRVMLFDEPTSALDPAMSADVLDVITELARGGQTMVVVTHDHSFARRAATQVVELVAGRVNRAGPAAEILASVGH